MPGKKPSTPSQQSFRATLEKGDRALGWTIARVPFDPPTLWTEMIRLRVQGTINGHAFRTSLFPDAESGGFYLLVNHAMQKGAGVRLGQMADFTLAPDLEPRPAELPDELAAILDEASDDADGDGMTLRSFYDSLSEYRRREIGKWIAQPKSQESRLKRCEQFAERLYATMEAERELPPAIRAAFRARPKAAAGWPKLTPTQRRNELMAVFYYQSPEARTKRIAKLCDLAETKG